MAVRRAIQIIEAVDVGGGAASHIVALCDDGTLWSHPIGSGGWDSLPPIPQDEPAAIEPVEAPPVRAASWPPRQILSKLWGVKYDKEFAGKIDGITACVGAVADGYTIVEAASAEDAVSLYRDNRNRCGTATTEKCTVTIDGSPWTFEYVSDEIPF